MSKFIYNKLRQDGLICKKGGKGDLHSEVSFCTDVSTNNEYIKKVGPVALLINEWVSHRVYKKILGDDFIQDIEINVDESGKTELYISKKVGEVVLSRVKEGSNGHAYLEKADTNQHSNIPSFCIFGGCKISSNWKNFLNPHSPEDDIKSKVGNLEINGAIAALYASRLQYEADVGAFANYILSRNGDEYKVSRFDMDETFAFLYKLRDHKSQKASINIQEIAKSYNKVSVDYMFNHQASISATLRLTTTSLIEPYVILYQNSFLYGHEYNEYILFYINYAQNIHKLPLEEGFASIFNVKIDEINDTISEGFKIVKDIYPNEFIKKIYNLATAKKIMSALSEGVRSGVMKIYDFDELSIIKSKDWLQNKDVIKYCLIDVDAIKNGVDLISNITQCMIAIRYVQMLYSAVCYNVIKFHNDLNLFRKNIADLPRIDADNYKCHNIPILFDTVSQLSIIADKYHLSADDNILELVFGVGSYVNINLDDVYSVIDGSKSVNSIDVSFHIDALEGDVIKQNGNLGDL